MESAKPGADGVEDPVLRALYRRYHRAKWLRIVFVALGTVMMLMGAPCLVLCRDPASPGTTVALCLLLGAAFLAGLVILLGFDIVRYQKEIEAHYFATGQQLDRFAAMYFSASATEQRSEDETTDE
jgi:hypothetical protein